MSGKTHQGKTKLFTTSKHIAHLNNKKFFPTDELYRFIGLPEITQDSPKFESHEN